VLPDTPEKPEELDILLEQEPRELLLINAILFANRESSTLLNQRKLAAANINGYAMHNDLLVHQNRLMVPNENTLRTRLCDEFHRPAHRAYSGRGKMRKIIFQQYFWSEIKLYINRYVSNCSKCKRNRSLCLKPAGLLRFLLIFQKLWQHVTMDFKFFNKNRHKYDAILVVINRLRKQSFSLLIHKTCTAADLAELCYAFPWRIFGTPETITSNRGPKFVAEFSKKLSKLIGIILQQLITEHAETDEQTEIVN
jgi:hypothetical protein